MDIHLLELFLAVMNSPSMTRAAEKIHLSPVAVSLQLHNLADELHTELFVRRGKRLVPPCCCTPQRPFAAAGRYYDASHPAVLCE